MTVGNLNLREAMVGSATRLRYITRFSNCPRVHDESVAEHSFYTAYFALLIVASLNRQGQKIKVGDVLSKALMHDIDECFSGDFIRMFKHSDPKLKEAINKACKQFTDELTRDLSKDTALQTELYYLWEGSKENVEGRIVAFADFLSVVSYIAQEVESGNRRMLLQVPELRRFFNSFLKLEFGFLKPYLEQADQIIRQLEEDKDVKRNNGKLEKAESLQK